MVHLQRFHEAFEQAGLIVYAICMNPDLDMARERTRELRITYPIFDGKGSEIGDRYAYG